MAKQSVSAFAEIQNRYGLSTPQQIKDRIVWNHLKAITKTLYGNSPEILAKLRTYEQDWLLCELEEKKNP